MFLPGLTPTNTNLPTTTATTTTTMNNNNLHQQQFLFDNLSRYQHFLFQSYHITFLFLKTNKYEIFFELVFFTCMTNLD